MVNVQPEILVTILMLVSLSTSKTIPQQSCPMEKVKIICSNIENVNWKVIGDQLTCEGDKSIKSTVAHSNVSSVVRTTKVKNHNAFLSEITAINIEYAAVNFIPYGIGSKFENLKALQIESCGLLSVNKGNLKQFGSTLELLSLPYNKIISIDADLFEYNPNLEAIWLNDNPIRHIDAEFFATSVDNLYSLEFFADINSVDCKTTFDTSTEWYHEIEWDSQKCTDVAAKLETENLINDKKACLLASIANSKSEIITHLESPYGTGAEVRAEVMRQISTGYNKMACKILKIC